MDWDEIMTLLQRADEHFPRLKYLWVGDGYRLQHTGYGTRARGEFFNSLVNSATFA
jgi:hypothetical protein